MRGSIIGARGVVLALLAHPAHAQTDCKTIQEKQSRNACFARAGVPVIDCAHSQDADDGAFCRDLSSRNPGASPPPQAPTDSVLAAALANCDAHAQQRITINAQSYFSSADREILVGQIEQERQQCYHYAEASAAQRVQDTRNQKLDQDRGYQRITVETFALDGKELAAKSAKVSASGSFLGKDNMGFLFADTRAVILATQYQNVVNNPRCRF